MRLVLLLSALALLLMPIQSNAQDDDRWFYAWDYDGGDLFAYTPSGDVRLLIDGEAVIDNGEPPPTWRGNPWELANGDFIMSIGLNDAEGFYYLHDGTAQLLEPRFNIDIIPFRDLDYEAREWLVESQSHVVIPISRWTFETSAILLFNLEAGTIELINNVYQPSGLYDIYRSTHGVKCCRLSEDSSFLRYWVFDGLTGSLLLKERDLITSEERIVYAINNTDINADAENIAIDGDLYGDRWIVGDRRTASTIIIYIDGRVEASSIYSGSIRGFFGNDLYTLDCHQRCVFHLYALNSLTPRSFLIPDIETNGYWSPLYQIDEERLVATDSRSYWMLNIDPMKEPQHIGLNPCQSYAIAPCFSRWLSPDGRWVLVTDQGGYQFATTATVWDLVDFYPLLEEACCSATDTDRMIFISYYEYGFVLTVDDNNFDPDSQPDKIVYLYSSNTFINIPGRYAYFEMLPDDTFLFTSARDRNGIYHYNPRTRISTLILPDASLVFGVNVVTG
jgi:hypothetical protein